MLRIPPADDENKTVGTQTRINVSCNQIQRSTSTQTEDIVSSIDTQIVEETNKEEVLALAQKLLQKL